MWTLAFRGMGATIVAALIDSDEGQLTVAHVGDSRAYLYRNNASELITSDHSWVHEQVMAGLLSEEAARNHPLKNVVTRALGGAQEPAVDIAERKLEVDDLLLLCSDGLNTMLSDQEINATLGRGTDLKGIAQQMVREANRKGGVDNITIILARARLDASRSAKYGDRMRAACARAVVVIGALAVAAAASPRLGAALLSERVRDVTFEVERSPGAQAAYAACAEVVECSASAAGTPNRFE